MRRVNQYNAPIYLSNLWHADFSCLWEQYVTLCLLENDFVYLTSYLLTTIILETFACCRFSLFSFTSCSIYNVKIEIYLKVIYTSASYSANLILYLLKFNSTNKFPCYIHVLPIYSIKQNWIHNKCQSHHQQEINLPATTTVVIQASWWTYFVFIRQPKQT